MKVNITITITIKKTYRRFFLDKLVDSFLPRYQEAVFRCRRLSEAAVQQLLLDAHAIKSLLLEVRIDTRSAVQCYGALCCVFLIVCIFLGVSFLFASLPVQTEGIE